MIIIFEWRNMYIEKFPIKLHSCNQRFQFFYLLLNFISTLRILYNVFCSQSSPNTFQINSHFLCIQHRSLSASSIKSTLCCPHSLVYMAFYWGLVDLLVVTLLRKTDSFSPRSFQVPITPQLVMGLQVYTPQTWIGFGSS